MLNWADQFSISVFLDSNEYDNHRYKLYECLVAVDLIASISSQEHDAFAKISQWHNDNQDWLFGHINYDYKNQLFSKLPPPKQGKFNFPDLFFFCPQTVCYINKERNSLTIETVTADADLIYQTIVDATAIEEEEANLPAINFRKRILEKEYLKTIETLKEHIRNGDCYEINFCNECFAEDVAVSPIQVFQKLNQLSPAPFAAFYKHQDQFLMCSSPERYVCKQAGTIISQPIKGTIKRGANSKEDNELRETLYTSEKDRAENVMIVDLTRNDLARSCAIGSINVEELYGIYSYPAVHQMISTIIGTLDRNTSFMDVLRHSFPMGSMTGAPKLKVMQLIDQYEKSQRQLFSGTIGYISPTADFDFNVVIRSLFYNQSTRYLSYQTGGAITYDSNPQQEWEETLLKAYNLEKLFRP